MAATTTPPTPTFEFRRIIVNQYFQLLLNRLPTTNEMDGYLNFLKSNRWENVVIDMLGNGNAAIPGSPPTKIALGLAREFWEVVN